MRGDIILFKHLNLYGQQVHLPLISGLVQSSCLHSEMILIFDKLYQHGNF